MAFNNYLEDENDKPYFTQNSLAYYYDKMEGFAKAVEGSAKALNLTKEEVEKRLTIYIEQNKNELDQRLADWDGKLETFDSSVETLLSEWVEDGTLNHVIDSTLIDQKLAPVTAKLVDTASGISEFGMGKKGLTAAGWMRPCLVIQDDDTYKQLYTELYPWAMTNNVPITSAAVSGIIGKQPYAITLEEFREMKDSGVVEYVNHTHTHKDLSTLTLAQVHDEIARCERFLESEGIYTKHLVYPYGGISDMVKEVASQYVFSATKSNGLIVDPTTGVLDSYRLNRVVFEEAMTTFQVRISQLQATGGCLIINTHVNYDTFSVEKLGQIVDLARAAGVDIVHYSEAFRRFGNLTELRKGQELIGGISAAGFTSGIFTKPEEPVKVILSTDILQTSPPASYPNRQISTFHMSGATATAGGWSNGPGVLYTDRRGPDDYTYQLFHPINSSKILKRTWNVATSTWTPFTYTGNNSGAPVKYTGGPYTIAGKRWQNVTVASAQFVKGVNVVANPDFYLPNGLVYNVWTDTDGSAVIKITNITDIDVVCPSGDWTLRVLKE